MRIYEAKEILIDVKLRNNVIRDSYNIHRDSCGVANNLISRRFFNMNAYSDILQHSLALNLRHSGMG